MSPECLLDLLVKALPLVTLPSDVLASSLEAAAGQLEVGPEAVVALLLQQPALLILQVQRGGGGLHLFGI